MDEGTSGTANAGTGANVVLGVSGGIAAYKACLLLRLLTEAGHRVSVVPTAAALRFVGAPTWAALSGRPVSDSVWDDVHEVPHVRLGQRADLVVVAPATADVLARAAHGIADDLLTNTLLTARCPILMAPAMHTEMWLHPATRANVATLRSRGVHVLDPAQGRLTGQDCGPGRLPEADELYAACLGLLPDDATRHAAAEADPLDAASRSAGEGLTARRVVVSAGGTREAIDPVRFLGNRSSGKQGYALAEVAAGLGARVTLVSANVYLPAPAGVEVVKVESALQMLEAMTAASRDADIVVMAAAVADFRPAEYVTSKIKKTHEPGDPDAAPTITLRRNPDILAGLVADRAARVAAGGPKTPLIIGFAAETGDDAGDVLEHARNKLARKGCDLLVANEVGADLVFGQDLTTVHILAPDGSVRHGRPGTKHDAARQVWAAVAQRLNPSA